MQIVGQERNGAAGPCVGICCVRNLGSSHPVNRAGLVLGSRQEFSDSFVIRNCLFQMVAGIRPVEQVFRASIPVIGRKPHGIIFPRPVPIQSGHDPSRTCAAGEVVIAHEPVAIHIRVGNLDKRTLPERMPMLAMLLDEGRHAHLGRRVHFRLRPDQGIGCVSGRYNRDQDRDRRRSDHVHHRSAFQAFESHRSPQNAAIHHVSEPLGIGLARGETIIQPKIAHRDPELGSTWNRARGVFMTCQLDVQGLGP